MRQALCALALLAPLHGQAQEAQACAATVGQLRALAGDQAFALRWEEVSMGDGKPLVVSIFEKNGMLFLEFLKTGEGLWAESAGLVCTAGAGLEARFAGSQVRLGPAAGWALRLALDKGGSFTLTRLEAGQLRIATAGWSGVFVPRHK